jgi:hypothetical protein
MDARSLATYKLWHASLKTDVEKLREHVNPDCEFHPPTYLTAWKGRDEFLLLMTCASEVFGESFQYGRQWISPDGKDWALEFTAKIGDSNLGITGVDLVKLDDEGRIKEFVVVARPPSGVAEMKACMMRLAPPRLAALEDKQALKK